MDCWNTRRTFRDQSDPGTSIPGIARMSGIFVYALSALSWNKGEMIFSTRWRFATCSAEKNIDSDKVIVQRQLVTAVACWQWTLTMSSFSNYSITINGSSMRFLKTSPKVNKVYSNVSNAKAGVHKRTQCGLWTSQTSLNYFIAERKFPKRDVFTEKLV